MRTEGPFQQRGLARDVLTAGLDRLAAAGCERFKVNYESANRASSHLYLTTGSPARPPAAHGPEADTTERVPATVVVAIDPAIEDRLTARAPEQESEATGSPFRTARISRCPSP